MGAGSSRDNRERPNVARAMSIDDPSSQGHRAQQVQQRKRSQNRKFQNSSTDNRNKDEFDWPLPPDIYVGDFEYEWPVSPKMYLEHFETAWSMHQRDTSTSVAADRKQPSTKISKAAKESVIKEGNQEKSTSNNWQMHYSSVHDSAHVQSTLRSQSHTHINISTVEEINRLINTLSNIQTNADSKLKRRLDQVSKETKIMIDRIVNDTQILERKLLGFGDERQKIFEGLYNEWLQKYIAILDQWYSKQLAGWQQRMSKHQKDIFAVSQYNIGLINDKANEIKKYIFIDEQRDLSATTQALLIDINTLLAQQGSQSLGSEKTTELNLLIRANVGTRLSNENHLNASAQNTIAENRLYETPETP